MKVSIDFAIVRKVEENSARLRCATSQDDTPEDRALILELEAAGEAFNIAVDAAWVRRSEAFELARKGK